MSNNSFHHYGNQSHRGQGQYSNYYGHQQNTNHHQQGFHPGATGNQQPFVLPEPIRALSQGGLISPEEEALARSFYRDVCASGLMPKLMKHSHAPIYGSPDSHQTNNKEVADRVRGIFAMLDAIDDRLLATVCALILEFSTNGENRPLNLEEVGRRVMGYPTVEANRGAGGTLLRAALWMIRFGYNNPTVCTAMMHEKQMKMRLSRTRRRS